jgi:membrane-bound serine protease (ClpP class)
MSYRAIVMLSVLLVLGASLALGQAEKPAGERGASPVFVIPIRGAIDDVVLESLKRRVAMAEAAGAKTVVLEMDTPGGLVSSALSICTFLKTTKMQTVAWVNPHAYSAGAMISVACNQIVMGPRGSIGDCAPIMLSDSGGLQSIGKTERKKIESPILEEFRHSAKRNGYPLVLCEAMVRLGPAIYELRSTADKTRSFVTEDELEHYGVKASDAITGAKPKTDAKYQLVKKVLAEDELLTMSQDEAIEYGFARKIIADDKELATFLGAPDAPIVRVEATWSEGLTSWLTSPLVRGVLITILMVCGYMELQAPGISLPGALALGALIILIGAPFITGLADMVDVLLILGGVALIAVEIFLLPGTIVPGVLGGAMVLIGLLMSFVPPEPGRWLPSMPGSVSMLEQGLLTVVMSVTAGVVLCIFLARHMGALPIFNRLILTSPRTEAAIAAERAISQSSAAVIVGDTGRVTSTLRPVGVADFGGRPVQVVSVGRHITAGAVVRVVRTIGNEVIVEEAET